MQREEFDRLLAGYATGQLSGEENARLLEAAMADQSLFNAVADEDALRETLADPQMKAELLRSLALKEKQSFWSSLSKSQIWAVSGAAAVSALAFVFMIQPQIRKPKTVEMAQAPAAKLAPMQPPGIAERGSPVGSEPIAGEHREAAQSPSDTIRDEPAKVKKQVDPQQETKRDKAATAAAPPPVPAPAFRAADETAQLKKDVEPQKETQRETLAAAAAPPPPSPSKAFRSSIQTVPAGAMAKSAGTVQPTLQYTVLRKNEQGEFVESSPGALLDKGDAIRLAVTSSGPGYISLIEAGSNRQIFYGFAEPGVRYVIPATEAITLDAAGSEKRFRLSLVAGAGNAAAQSLAEQNAQQNAGPVSQSTVEIVVRTR